MSKPNPTNTGAAIAMPASDSSEANRKKLQAWSESSDYKSISFWIPPNMQPGTDECVAEVANALIKFEEARKSGSIKPEVNFVV
jgi:hypothetical protein